MKIQLQNLVSLNEFKDFKKMDNEDKLYNKLYEEFDDYMSNKTGFSDSLLGRASITALKLLKRGYHRLIIKLKKDAYDKILKKGIIKAYSELKDVNTTKNVNYKYTFSCYVDKNNDVYLKLHNDNSGIFVSSNFNDIINKVKNFGRIEILLNKKFKFSLKTDKYNNLDDNIKQYMNDECVKKIVNNLNGKKVKQEGEVEIQEMTDNKGNNVDYYKVVKKIELDSNPNPMTDKSNGEKNIDLHYFDIHKKEMYEFFKNNPKAKDLATKYVNKEAILAIQFSVHSSIYHTDTSVSNKFLSDKGGGINKDNETSVARIWKKYINEIKSKYSEVYLNTDLLDPYYLMDKYGNTMKNNSNFMKEVEKENIDSKKIINNVKFTAYISKFAKRSKINETNYYLFEVNNGTYLPSFKSGKTEIDVFYEDFYFYNKYIKIDLKNQKIIKLDIGQQSINENEEKFGKYADKIKINGDFTTDPKELNRNYITGNGGDNIKIKSVYGITKINGTLKNIFEKTKQLQNNNA